MSCHHWKPLVQPPNSSQARLSHLICHLVILRRGISAHRLCVCRHLCGEAQLQKSSKMHQKEYYEYSINRFDSLCKVPLRTGFPHFEKPPGTFSVTTAPQFTKMAWVWAAIVALALSCKGEQNICINHAHAFSYTHGQYMALSSHLFSCRIALSRAFPNISNLKGG